MSAHDEGALFPGESQLSNGKQPKILDIVDIPLLKQMSDPLQPENWLIDKSRRWSLMNAHYDTPDLPLLSVSPPHLWREPDGLTDRVSAEFLKTKKLNNSIRLIHVPEITLQFGWRAWQGQYRQRRRVIFDYKGETYDLSVTDPEFVEKHADKIPSQGKKATECQLRPPNGFHLCVSLAPELNGYHYKVVATVLEG